MNVNPLRAMTGSIRLFTTEDLSLGHGFAATPEQAHYLGAVMRREAGSDVLLFNGRDGEFRCEIASLRKDRAQFVPRAQTRAQQVLPPLTLVFAPLKRDTTHLVIEKATELGATRILPVFTDRTNAARINLDRCLAIAREAAEQCERLCLPEIAEPVRLFDLLGAWPASETLSAAIERGGAPWPGKRATPGALLVGPEGGFTPTELDAMRRLPFIEPIGLGPRILRAETAAIVGLALLQASTYG
jgi:16S rRNA (uracil1498-N3)-methyltransferase